MPRRRRDQAVEERAGQIPAESTSGRQRRRRGARQGVQTRRERRGAQAQDQAPSERGTRRNVPRQRVHEDLLTVAFRGPLAARFRELAQRHEMSLSKLVQDALLAWENSVAAGYEPGTALAQWKAQHGQAAEGA